MSADEFNACLSNQDVMDAVYANYNNAIDLGVNGTPTFFINGTRYVGEMTLAQLDQAIEPLLPASTPVPASTAAPRLRRPRHRLRALQRL